MGADSIQLRAGLYQCQVCQAVVKDWEEHERWHDKPAYTECIKCYALLPYGAMSRVQIHMKWHEHQEERIKFLETTLSQQADLLSSIADLLRQK